MKSSDDLFLLIKSLDKSEKRYFRLFSSFHGGDKKYMQVFDALEKQKYYDEKKIISKFERQGRIFGKDGFAKRFPGIKHYLYNLILNSLESYKTTIDSSLHSYLNKIEILFQKGLYTQCEKVIEKGKQLAIKYDEHLALLKFLNWEIQLLEYPLCVLDTEDSIKQFYNGIFNTIDQYKTNIKLSMQISLLGLQSIKKGNIRRQSEMKELQVSIESSLLNFNEKGLSFKLLFGYYSAFSSYFFIKNDYKRAYPYLYKLMDLMEAHPHQLVKLHMKYIQVIYNLFGCLLYLKEYQKAADVINKLNKLELSSPNEKRILYFYMNYMQIALCYKTAAFKEGLRQIKLLENDNGWNIIDKNNNVDVINIDPISTMIIQYLTACFYFATEEYREANKYLNKIINNPIDNADTTQCFAQILSLLVHFEQGNLDLLEYKVKSVYRFLYKKNSLYKLETIILEFIRKELPEINYSEKALIKSFEVLLTKIKTLTKNPFERRALDYFDFVSWLESKIKGISFAEVVKEKAGKEL